MQVTTCVMKMEGVMCQAHCVESVCEKKGRFLALNQVVDLVILELAHMFNLCMG